MRPIRLALFSSRCRTCHKSRINCVCRTKTVTNCSYVNKQIHLTLLSIDIEIPQTSFDRHILGYRQAGCLQLSHRLLLEMCGLRTRPRTDVDPPRRLPPSNCHRRGGISSRRFQGDTLLVVMPHRSTARAVLDAAYCYRCRT